MYQLTILCILFTGLHVGSNSNKKLPGGHRKRPTRTLSSTPHTEAFRFMAGSDEMQKHYLLGAGIGLAILSRQFYKAKKTIPFKISYFLTWPVLGTGVIQLVQTEQQSKIDERIQR